MMYHEIEDWVGFMLKYNQQRSGFPGFSQPSAGRVFFPSMRKVDLDVDGSSISKNMMKSNWNLESRHVD